MSRILRRSLLLLLAAAAAGWAESAPGLKDSRPFFQDVGGYHAQGRAQAADRTEAIRLAKADALNRLFSEIGKDVIFGEMCISGWPEYITVEETVAVEQEGVTLAQVQVAVATSAIMLTEQKYQVTVTELLGSAESTLAQVDKDLADADELERNLKVAEALAAYRRAKTRAAEVRVLVKDVGDKSLVSDSGNNIAAIAAKMDALSLRIAGGLERMEAIEREAQKSAAADEMTKAFDLYEQELQDMEARGEKYAEQSPFYDLPRAKLDAILLEIQADRTKDAQIAEKLEQLRATVPQERDYLRQKTELSLVDAQALAQRLEKMEGELRLEIRTPRLARQEQARRRKAALAALGAGAKYVFLHKPMDILAFTWDLPLFWDMDNPIRATGEADLLLEAEGVFAGGLWVRGTIGHDVVTDSSGASTWKSSAWSSGFDIGVGKKTVLGIGISWDWGRTIADPETEAEPTEAEREMGLRLDLGGVDQERRRTNWMLSLGYGVPMVPAGQIVLPYHLNAYLSARVKAGDILILKAAVRSKAYQTLEVEEENDFFDTFAYRFDWSVGVGIRLPPPFVIGISYGGQVTAEIEPEGLVEADPYVGGWGFSLGYAL